MNEEMLVDILQDITNTIENLADEVKDLKEDMRYLKRGELKEVNAYITDAINHNDNDNHFESRIESLEKENQELQKTIESIKTQMKIQHMLVDEMM